MRDPDVLRVASAWLTPRCQRPRVLSFGCSLGDELATLKAFFPGGDILGCDVNPHALEVAQRSMGSFADVFRSTPDAIRDRGPFDVICAFNSLCRHPAPADIAAAFSFVAFSGVMDLFAQVLAPGGVLALFNTNYLLQHTAAAALFDTVRSDSLVRNGWVDVYAPDGARIMRSAATPASYAQTIESSAGLHDDWDLVDSVFVRRSGPVSGSARQVIPFDRYNPQLQVEMDPLIEWTRSDLDPLSPDRRPGYVDVRRRYRLFKERGSSNIWLEKDVWRSSVLGQEDLHVARVGRARVELESSPIVPTQ